jgi:hypothetical protein
MEEMTLTLRYTGTLTIETCGECGITFAAPEDLINACKANHSKGFWCPLGHHLYYTGETEAQKLTRQLRAAKSNSQWYQDQLGAAERSKAALKGHLTRARNKIAAGNCPVPDCGQHFANVREHMKFKHPDFHLTDPETGEVAAL